MIPMFRICAMGNVRATTAELPFRRSADPRVAGQSGARNRQVRRLVREVLLSD
jgi:hypothetical protein